MIGFELSNSEKNLTQIACTEKRKREEDLKMSEMTKHRLVMRPSAQTQPTEKTEKSTENNKAIFKTDEDSDESPAIKIPVEQSERSED